MVNNTKNMHIGIKLALIAMGMMTGVAGAPAAVAAQKEDKAPAAATATTKSSMFSGFGDKIKARTSSASSAFTAAKDSVKSGATAAASSASSAFTAAKDSVKSGTSSAVTATKETFNTAVGATKKGRYGQNKLAINVVNKIDPDTMLAALQAKNPLACAYKNCVNGAVALVLCALPTESESFKTDLVQELNALCEYEVGSKSGQSKASDWKTKVESLIDKIGGHIASINGKLAKEKDNVKRAGLTKSINTLTNLITVLKSARDKVSNTSTGLTPFNVCFQQCSKEQIDKNLKTIKEWTNDVKGKVSQFIDDCVMKYNIPTTSAPTTNEEEGKEG